MTATEMPRLSLVLPTYNERANIANAIARIASSLEASNCSFEIIVVDDDSPDGTWMIAEDIAKRDLRVRVLRRLGERGLATAVVAGWRMARGQVLGVMDADLQYPPETLPTLLDALDRSAADVAICSRYAPGATVQHWSIVRWFISWAARLAGRLLLPSALRGIADPGAGYFVLRRHVIEGIALTPRGFKILIEVLARGRHNTVIEVGLPYEGRKEGQSKFRGRQVVEYLAHLAQLTRDTGEGSRSLLRGFVGVGAVAAGMWLLWALTVRAGLHYLVSALIAAEAGILITFLGYKLLGITQSADQRTIDIGHWQVMRIPGMAAGLLMLGILTEAWQVPYLTGALLAVLGGMVVDYAFGAQSERKNPSRSVATT